MARKLKCKTFSWNSFKLTQENRREILQILSLQQNMSKGEQYVHQIWCFCWRNTHFQIWFWWSFFFFFFKFTFQCILNVFLWTLPHLLSSIIPQSVFVLFFLSIHLSVYLWHPAAAELVTTNCNWLSAFTEYLFRKSDCCKVRLKAVRWDFKR